LEKLAVQQAAPVTCGDLNDRPKGLADKKGCLAFDVLVPRYWVRHWGIELGTVDGGKGKLVWLMLGENHQKGWADSTKATHRGLWSNNQARIYLQRITAGWEQYPRKLIVHACLKKTRPCRYDSIMMARLSWWSFFAGTGIRESSVWRARRTKRVGLRIGICSAWRSLRTTVSPGRSRARRSRCQRWLQGRQLSYPVYSVAPSCPGYGLYELYG
jgi:hypothetical protein